MYYFSHFYYFNEIYFSTFFPSTLFNYLKNYYIVIYNFSPTIKQIIIDYLAQILFLNNFLVSKLHLFIYVFLPCMWLEPHGCYWCVTRTCFVRIKWCVQVCLNSLFSLTLYNEIISWDVYKREFTDGYGWPSESYCI